MATIRANIPAETGGASGYISGRFAIGSSDFFSFSDDDFVYADPESLLAVDTPRSRTQRPRSARLIRLQRAPASQQFRSRSLPLSGDHVSFSKRANRRSNAAPLLRLVQGRPARR